MSCGHFALSATLWRRSAHGSDHCRVGFDCDLSDSPFGDWPRSACPKALPSLFFSPPSRDRRLPYAAWCCEGWSKGNTGLGLDNGRRDYRWLFLGVFRRRWSVRCAAAADDVLRFVTVGGARSGAGARFPECASCTAGLCRGRSGRLAGRITPCAWWHRGDLRWRQVRQPPARETDAAGILWTLAAYRDAAGTAGLIETEHQIAFPKADITPEKDAHRALWERTL
jgi:hypothetical protein